MERAKASPPRFFLKFFRWYCHPKMRDYIEGDLMEVYDRRVRATGKHKADLLFIMDVVLLFRGGIIKPMQGYKNLNTYGMFKNYFTIGWRSLLRNKCYSILNISGLATGMAVAMLIGLWVFDELSFNRSFPNYDRIGRIYHNLNFGDRIYTHDGVPYPMGSELKSTYPEFEEVVMASEQGEHIIGYKETKSTQKGIFVMSQFIDMFSVHLMHGTDQALKGMHSIVLSKTLADNLIGNDAIGKIIKFDNRDNLIVTGVFEDFPANSAFAEVKLLLPMEYYFTAGASTRNQMNSWEDYSFQCFVTINKEKSFTQIDAKIKNVLYQKVSGDGKAIKPEGFLFPMKKWHLNAEFKEGKNVGGKIQFVLMFGSIGIFVLALACINFMNLSTARSEKRSKEVGIRKVMGSVRRQLVSQFLSESLLVVIIAFMMSVAIVVFCLPWFNDLANKQMNIPWANFSFLFISFAFVLITSVLAGSYPAVYLSSLNPIKVLKGSFRTGRFASLPRKVMVVFQFMISTTLIIGTIVVFQEIKYAKDRPAGFDREGIIFIPIRTEDLARADYNSLRTDLLATEVVDNMAESDYPTTGGATGNASLTWEGKDPAYRPLVALNSCSHDFPRTNGFQFVEGRDFSREFSTDSSALIVNEMAARLLSEKSPIGKKVKFASGREREVIGVIKDQVRWTPFSKQSPHMYFVDSKAKGYLTVRIKPSGAFQQALGKIEAVLKKYDPGAPFDYKFLDDDYARLFNDEERIGRLSSVFAALAVFISCLGIFGLASFTANQRTKEIGIRKVLGASIFNVWQMLSRNFTRLVVLSVLLASPMAYYFSNQWLQQYDYRIQISWLVFAVTGTGVLMITLLTVSYQSIKAATANPVNSLRSE